MIIAITGEKGGTGKTTLAVNLAGMRANSGHDVILMDADRQGSASYWAETRDHTKSSARPGSALDSISTVETVQKFGSTLYRTALSLAQRYDDVLIDLPSGEQKEMHYALDIADVVIIPLQPSAFDSWTIGEMDVKVNMRMRDRPDLRAYCLINRASFHPQSRDKRAAIAALSQCIALTCPDAAITDRAAVRRASGAGLTVAEYRPQNKKTTAEFQKLYELVFREQIQAQRNGARP